MYVRASLSTVNACKHLDLYHTIQISKDTHDGKIALLCKVQRLRVYNNYYTGMFLKVFDCQRQSIIQFGSERLGLKKATQYCERVCLFALAANIRRTN